MLNRKINDQTRLLNRRLPRFARCLLLLTVLSAVALAQQPAQQLKPSADRLRETVTYLASDALQGRRTGSPGANDAAHYIAGEFQRLGLQPGSPVVRGTRLKGAMLARYQQRFPYIAGVELGKNNLLFVNPGRAADTAQFKVGEDWMPLGFSSSGKIDNAPTVFVGYGITAAELKYDDYTRVDVKGKIAFALMGTPDGDNPHGQFARYEDVRWKAIAARNAGAIALMVIAHEENFKEDRLTTLHYDNSGGDAGLPVLVVSRRIAAKLLGMEDTAVLGRMESTVAKWVLGGGPAANCKTPCGVTANFPLPVPGTITITIAIDIVRHQVAAANVIGILEGSDPQLKSEAIVIGAHYDHLGLGGEGSLAPRSGEIHHGADDNASGVAGLLELARIFSAQRPKPRRTTVFIAFSGEEEGLLGSNYYVNHPVVPMANVAAMINMDMIGRMKDGKLIVGGVGTAKEWPTLVNQHNLKPGSAVALAESNTANPPPGLPKMGRGDSPTIVTIAPGGGEFQLTMNQDGYGPSDHSSFYSKNVPVLFFFTGSHEDYHKPSDTADKINYADEARILAMVVGILKDVDLNKRPTYTVAKSDSTGRASGFRVYLGTIPNYGETNDGLLLDGVRDDSPAAKAGLKAGDKIVKLAGRDVRNVYDYTYALGEMKAGEEYEIEVMRGGERLKLKLVPAARK